MHDVACSHLLSRQQSFNNNVMDLSASLFILITILSISYWYLTRTFSHWKKQKIPCLLHPLPGFGHILPIITLRQSLHDFTVKAYYETDASVIGLYFMQNPAILVRDPELIKSVLVTNFSSFRTNAIQFNEKLDPVMANHPFFTANPHTWKVSRARAVNHLSNRKLGQLYFIIDQVCSKMNSYLIRKTEIGNNIVECELKDLFSRYTGEIVANAAFGIEGQSFEDNPTKWAFVNVARAIFDPKFINSLRQTLIFFLPEMANLLRLSFLQKDMDQYLRENMKIILKQRKMMDCAPNDFLQFCIETNTEDDVHSIIADIITFFFDVYETSSTALSTVFYHLSKNEDIQTKLREHIVVITGKYDGQITYESLKDMGYLEQVIYESMRLTPPFPTLFKMCTQEITLQGTDGLQCHLMPGNSVLIPLIALNHDEKYWPNARKFDPNRFTPEEQSNRSKFVFLPFGEGPRQCLGFRLGLILVKLATASLIQKYTVEPSDLTREPLEMEPSSFMTYVKGGLWAKFKRLDQKG